jgi:hypothetical protein
MRNCVHVHGVLQAQHDTVAVAARPNGVYGFYQHTGGCCLLGQTAVWQSRFMRTSLGPM